MTAVPKPASLTRSAAPPLVAAGGTLAIDIGRTGALALFDRAGRPLDVAVTGAHVPDPCKFAPVLPDRSRMESTMEPRR